MNKSTIAFLLITTLGLGTLIGAGISSRHSDTSPQSSDTGLPLFRTIKPGDLPVELDAFDRAKPSTIGENYIAGQKVWKEQTLTVSVPFGEAIEYKAIMEQGDSIVFDWSTENGKLYTDFHAHDDAFGDDFFVRYQELEGDFQSGMIVAAFDGEHGWYWLNMGEGSTNITLRVAGFFDEIIRVEVESYE
jgi:hypothetical protein